MFSAKTANDTIDTSASSSVTCEQQVEDLLKRANVQAAQYDYDKATASIKAFEDYEKETSLTAALAKYVQGKAKLVKYADMSNITHIFFHSLIVDPQITPMADTTSTWQLFRSSKDT
ncbi:MAG: hypothetical protein LBP35_04500 [Candidatus Ancillula trichonymphae]|nr:hypothetical protein [Candidatus Ancillula trichonymphae]